MLKLTLTVALVLVTGALLLFAVWPLLRHRATYPGGRLSPDEGDPARWGLPTAEQVWLRASDGVRLHGWWTPASPVSAPARPHRDGEVGDGCGAVIYFHGNGNTIAPRAWIAARLSRLGLHTLLFDYRGYGLSDGRPSEAGLRRDARAAWEHVVEERGVAPERLILFGHSLGSAVATELALDRPAAALVLGAPFGGFPDLFRHHAPWLPLRLLPWRDGRYEAGSVIAGLQLPVVIAVGEADRLIPPRISRAVHDAAPEPRRLIVTDAEHNTLIGHPAVWRAVEELVREELGCS